MRTKDLMFFSYCLGIFWIIALFDGLGFVGVFLFHAYFILVALGSRYMHWYLTLILILFFCGRLCIEVWKLDQSLILDWRIYLGVLMWTTYTFTMAKIMMRKKKIYERVGKLR